MKRGIPNITVYMFEAAPGRELNYPDAELWTLDEDEARTYAKKNGYQLVGSDCQREETELIEDYTPRPRFEFIDADGEDITGDADQEETACRVRAYNEDTDTAATEAMRDESTWYIFWPLGSSAEGYPAWRDAMKAAGVSDFRELDD